MDDVKRVYREGETKTKETARELDGHSVSDDIGNAGDELRKNLGNAGDRARNAEQDAERNVDADTNRNF
jgi:hypothetical protein